MKRLLCTVLLAGSLFGADADLNFNNVVTIFSDRGELSVATGVKVGKDLIMTCRHLFDDANMSNVVLMDFDETKKYVAPYVVAQKKDLDIVLLKVHGAHFKSHFELSKTEPKIGDIIYTMGMPFGRVISSSGHITKVTDTQVSFLADSDFGDSGGPLLNEMGELIGIINLAVMNKKNKVVAVVATRASTIFGSK